MALCLELTGMRPKEFLNLPPIERQLVNEVALKLEQERYQRQVKLFKKLFSG